MPTRPKKHILILCVEHLCETKWPKQSATTGRNVLQNLGKVSRDATLEISHSAYQCL